MKINEMVSFFRRIEEITCSLLLICMLVVTFTQIIFRYVFRAPLTWSEEFARLMFIWLNLIGASTVTRNKANVSLDLIVSHFPAKIRLIIETVMNLLIMVALIWIFIPSIKYVQFMNTIPSAALEWPMGVFYIGMPVAIIFICVTLVRQLSEAAQKLLTGRGDGEFVK
ncbi:MAG: TRAP transporter small permease [Bacteroidota bacterium]